MKVILFYKFRVVDKPDALADEIREFGNSLRGRILVSCDGINGTVAGYDDDVEAFEQKCIRHICLRLNPDDFRSSWAETQPFSRLHVKATIKEINMLREKKDVF
jgi:predicted sulfurtransferase